MKELKEEVAMMLGKERQRVAEEERKEKEAAEKREANKRHRAKINNGAAEKIANILFDNSISQNPTIYRFRFLTSADTENNVHRALSNYVHFAEKNNHQKIWDKCLEDAKNIIEAIAKGEVPHVSITY